MRLEVHYQRDVFTPGFFAPIKYDTSVHKNRLEKAVEFFDAYFFWGGEYIHISTEVDVFLAEKKTASEPLYKRIFKAISIVTIVIPIFMAIGKCICRSRVKFNAFPNHKLFFKKLEQKTVSFKVPSFAKVIANFIGIPCFMPAIRVDNAYIHANRIGYDKNNKEFQEYIATQHPCQTPELFWKMIRKTCSPVIFDLTGKTEKVKKRMIYESYYGQKKEFGNLQIHQLKQEVDSENPNIVATSYLTKEKDIKPKNIVRIHYTGWEDFGGATPETLDALVKKAEGFRGPITVHCRAGVGRTGAFITALELKRRVKNGSIDPSNFIQVIEEIILTGRRHRGPMFVQTPEQVKTIFEYVKYLGLYES